MKIAIPTLLASLFLTTCSLGAAPGIALETRQDDPQVSKDAINAGLEKRRADLLKLEQSVQALRDEVKQQLGDAVAGQQAVTLKARKAFEDAKAARLLAAFAVKEYLLGTFLQDKALAKGMIGLAKSDLERAAKRKDEIREMMRRGVIRQNDVIASELDYQKAEFDLEEAEISLKILEEYTKDKETKARQAALTVAEAVEAEKKGLLEIEEAREAKLREIAGRLRVRSPEDLVVSLIEDAVQLEDQVVGLITETQKIEAQIRDRPDQAEALKQQLVAKKDEAISLMNRAKSQLLEASQIGEQTRISRTKLGEAEAKLRNERQILDRLEAEFAKKR